MASSVSLEGGPGAPTTAIAAGERRYAVGKVVAAGGMGAIRQVTDRNIRRTVAMKVMRDPDAMTRDQVLRFIEEAQITGQLQHPGIVPVHDLGVDAYDQVYYTMKFVQGETLAAILQGLRARQSDVLRRYPLSALLRLFLRICDAVAYAHSRGVIHRDLKPENVMVGDFGETLVMDWAGEGPRGRPGGDRAGRRGARAAPWAGRHPQAPRGWRRAVRPPGWRGRQCLDHGRTDPGNTAVHGP